MWFPSRIRRRRPGRNPVRAGRFVPQLEGLEGRALPSTLTVLNTLDRGAGSLRDAVTRAKDGDTIAFAPGLAGQTIVLTGDALEIKKSVNIAGPGAGLLAVSGNDAHRVFDVREGVTARIAGLTVTHGRVVGNNGGGAVLNSGGSLALADDVFSDNVAVGNFSFGNIDTLPVGGAVRNRNNATLTVTNCAFVGNKALGEEGGGNAWGGGLSNDSGSAATVTGCAFTANVAAGGDGGRSTSGQLIVGHGEGGGIANFAACTVRNCTFTANLAAGGSGCAGDAQNAFFYTIDVGNGGGIENFPGAVLFVDGCTFAYNRAVGGSNATGSPLGQRGRLGNGSGGGVKNEATATITNSLFDHNEAVGGDGNAGAAGDVLVGVGQGGGIENGTVAVAATLTARNLTMTYNRAAGGAGNTGAAAFVGAGFGGGFSNRSGSTAAVSHSTFDHNQAVGGTGADGLGGGVANLAGCTITLSHCTVTNNQAVGGSGASPGRGEGGGAYFADGGTAILDVSTVIALNRASTSHDDVFGFSTISP